MPFLMLRSSNTRSFRVLKEPQVCGIVLSKPTLAPTPPVTWSHIHILAKNSKSEGILRVVPHMSSRLLNDRVACYTWGKHPNQLGIVCLNTNLPSAAITSCYPTTFIHQDTISPN
ncbi:unnamed protein product [Ranitomeya imitator]|uniref:Uncharacterized protein n=1 Tax=Ranitomeya imitator TaxID=111125 RepID=A0ABN9MM41_9NEOB|nr:unnamed protein product [Ranitomeya imitator]